MCLWSALFRVFDEIAARPVSPVTREAGDALVAALVAHAPWQRGQCARTAWACAARAARRRGTWPRTLPLPGSLASARQFPAEVLPLFLSALHGDDVGARIYAAAVADAQVRA